MEFRAWRCDVASLQECTGLPKPAGTRQGNGSLAVGSRFCQLTLNSIWRYLTTLIVGTVKTMPLKVRRLSWLTYQPGRVGLNFNVDLVPALLKLPPL